MKNSSHSRRGDKTRPCRISDIAPHTELLEPISAALESEPPANYCLEPLTPDRTLISPPEVRVGVTQTNDDFFHSLSGAVPALRGLSVDARDATNTEHRMTFLDGCRLYPKAIAWSALLSTTIVLEGYGTILLNSFLAIPVFRRTFGVPTNPNFLSDERKYEISPMWQAGLINAAYAGQILGLMLNGLLTDRFGYHRVMVGSLICLSLFLFLTVFAINIGMLLASQVLCGFPWGIFQTLSMTYAAEVVPLALRAYLTANINNCWLVGQISATGILRGFINVTSEWSFRVPLALQWAFAIPILIVVLFAPESPWWLVRHERHEQAKKSLLRLTQVRSDVHINADKTITMLHHTNEAEKYLNGSDLSYLSCFKGTDFRRTEIACMVWITQSLCGAALSGYAVYFFQQAGLSTQNSFNVGLGMFGAALVGGILSWIWLRIFGRRTLYLWGLILSFIILLVIGGVGTLKESEGTSWAIGCLIITFTFIYDTTIGPVCYVLVAEIPSTRLRVKTVVLARVAYNLISLVVNIVTPRMLNPTAWNWGGLSAFLYAGTTLYCLLWAYFRLPEPKGLTYLELDILFNKKASARRFRRVQRNLESSGYFSLTQANHRDRSWWGYS
ncbi:hypothetical protein N7530_003051 [Penicillium desertorum]|uniref:Major facilitator superfamily (MFS) profile domain-containing protein n=1 Tax=Penicillium desertorum TaxID=1303715 RepID=A0A9X0BU10_9EURO|nr:hypothetical protein N7530_003051 [Penicillium desertorum]